MNNLKPYIIFAIIGLLFCVGLVVWGVIDSKTPQKQDFKGKVGTLFIEGGSAVKGIVQPAEIRVETLGVKVITAYSSTPEQTDSTPFTTASMTQVRDGIVAYNCLPFKTRIRIPELFGQKIFVVEDRMNKKWGCSRIDIWMEETHEAIKFGIKKEMIELVK